MEAVAPASPAEAEGNLSTIKRVAASASSGEAESNLPAIKSAVPATSQPGKGLPRRGLPPSEWPRTWTGRSVSPEEWATLSDWDRRGPDGRLWCGVCRVWHMPGDCLTDPDGVARRPEAIEAVWDAAERMVPAVKAEREGEP